MAKTREERKAYLKAWKEKNADRLKEYQQKQKELRAEKRRAEGVPERGQADPVQVRYTAYLRYRKLFPHQLTPAQQNACQKILDRVNLFMENWRSTRWPTNRRR